MNEHSIVAVSGRMSHGKDELFKIAKKHFPDEVIKLSFADCLKKEVAEALVCRHYWEFKDYLFEIFEGIPYLNENVEAIFQQTFLCPSPRGGAYRDYYAQGYDRSYAVKTLIEEMNHPELKKKFRLLLQFWGTEYRRRQDENYWVNKFFEELEKPQYMGLVVFVCDVRFPNEFELMHSQDAITVRVIRTDIPVVSNEHLSETALDGETRWKHVIYNDGTPNYEDAVLKVLNPVSKPAKAHNFKRPSSTYNLETATVVR
jgi:hypothetical protein